MKVFDKSGKEFNLQEKEDTGWEYLEDTNKIKGRIKNNIVTIIIDRFAVTGSSGNNVNIINLPSKYIPSRDIPFLMFTNGIATVACNARLNANGIITCYIRTDGGQYNGVVIYPIKDN